jgi:hypothetical protein
MCKKTITRKVGCLGAAFDAPGTLHAYSYSDQPDDLGAHRLSRAVWAAFDRIQQSSGDSGLALLLELEGYGFGVYELEPKE